VPIDIEPTLLVDFVQFRQVGGGVTGPQLRQMRLPLLFDYGCALDGEKPRDGKKKQRLTAMPKMGKALAGEQRKGEDAEQQDGNGGLGVRAFLLNEVQGHTQGDQFQHHNLETDERADHRRALFLNAAVHNGLFTNEIGHQSFLWQPGS
jgi:hypothetical protein